MKISQKLILGVLFIIALTAIAEYFSIRISQKVLEDKIGRYSATQATMVLDAIEMKIQSRIEQVQAYAIDLSKESTIWEHRGDFETENSIIQQNDQQWQSDFQQGRTNILMDKIQHNDLSCELREEFVLKDFYEKAYGYPIWVEVFVTNEHGANIAQSEITSDYYQADEDWWIKAKNDNLYIGDVNYDDSAGMYSIIISSRINDKEGNFLSVLKAEMNIHEILDILDEVEKDSPFSSMDFKLLTGEGYLIHATEGNSPEFTLRC